MMVEWIERRKGRDPADPEFAVPINTCQNVHALPVANSTDEIGRAHV